MAPNELRTDVAIAVFAKAPVQGFVKTRLVPVLGAPGAAALHRQLVERTVATAVEAAAGPVTLWCAPDASHPFFAEVAARHGVELAVQSGPELGARMAAAFEHAFASGRALVLAGCDTPAFEARHFREAAGALARHDAAFVPAEDGGYMLVALARPVPGLFEGIAWGRDDVMERSRERLRAAGARWTELPPLWDVDRPEDYARLRASRLMALPEASP
jgi:rSAM/selenodomain-associated transferase 1